MNRPVVRACTVAMIVAGVVLAVMAVAADMPPGYLIGVTVALLVLLVCGMTIVDAAKQNLKVAVDLVRQWPDGDRADALNWVPSYIRAAAGVSPSTSEETSR